MLLQDLIPAALDDWLYHDWVLWWLLPGIGAALIAVLAWAADRRRMRRSNPDAVGLIAWRDISFWATFAALPLLLAALRGWLNAG